jgi:prepilin-type N-terminal cleavage/methylation domain-containing protein
MSDPDDGYTLVELVVVMFIFAVVMTIISASFNKIVASSGQITKAGETDIGGLIGLELFRSDLELAGFGLPWSLPGAVIYSESSDDVLADCPDGCPKAKASAFNDAPSNAPRAYVVGDNVGYNGSDYLVLKGTALGMSATSRKWSYLSYSSTGAVIKPSKSADFELTPGNSDRVIVIKSGITSGSAIRELVTNGPGSSSISLLLNQPLSPGFLPASKDDNYTYLVYGVAPADSSALSFPFNRADYFISRKDKDPNIPSTCADNTGVLYKTVINQSPPPTKFPLLDCVADMQVVLYMDTNGDGKVDYHPHLSDSEFTAGDLREQLKEIRVYILAQQGKKDAGYSYPLENLPIIVGDASLDQSLGRRWSQSDLAATFGSDWRHYHWKLYTIVVQPKNL